MGRSRCILTLDVGSSSVRARRYDRGLSAPDASAARRYRWRMEDGAMECDPLSLFSRVRDVIDAAVVSSIADGAEIAAVAVTTFWHSLLGLDARGDPVTPLYGWGDSRAFRDAEMLAARLSPADYHRRTGCFLGAAYPAVRIAWLKRVEPATFAAVRTWVSFGDYLESRLFGTMRSSYSMASATGLLDISSLAWDGATLEALGIGSEHLPALVDLEPASGLRPEWSARWPSLAEVPFLPAVGDGACANVGSGAVGPQRPGLTVGTSAAVRVVRSIAGATPPPRLWDYRLDKGEGVTGGALSNGGNALTFLLRWFHGMDAASIDAMLAASEPDAHGLTVIPSLVRERGAGSPRGVASIIGLRSDTRPLDVAHAWLEAVAHRIASYFTDLEHECGEAVEVRASGGALHAVPAWLRTFADVLGRPIRLTADPEATSRGTAIVAAREIGWIDSLEDAPARILTTFEPDAARHEIHQSAMIRERAIAAALETALDAKQPAEPAPADSFRY